MRIILNADDFGYDEDTTQATIECFERAGLTSATIMPKMPATQQAIAYAKAHDEFSFGVHLTYCTDTVEAPVCPPGQIPSLVDKEGAFLNSNTVRWKSLWGRLSIAEIELETKAQIAFLQDHGVKVSHVDSHGHIHKFGPFREALRRVLPLFHITRVRNAQNLYLKRPLKSPTYWLGGIWRQRIMKKFETTESFYMPGSSLDADWSQALLAKLEACPPSDLEIGFHPGYQETWRDQERLDAQAFGPMAQERGHELVTWNQI